MRTLTYQLRDLKKFMICIGFEDENNRTQVRIDCGEVFAEYPNAAVTMKVQAPKGGIYPATVAREDDVILWTVRDCDVANKGSGEFQLTFTDGTTVVKTCVGKFHVDRSLKGSGTAPSGVQDWLDHAEDVLEQVESAEIHQPMIGLDGYWYKWDQEAGEYVSTGTKAQGQDGQPGTDATPDLIAKDYADLSFPVAKDSFCYHDGKLYQAKQAIQTAEDWTAAHWQETTVEEKITDIKNALPSKSPENFGAKGDGVTDDTAAIQAAIDANYDVYFASDKTYYVGGTVVIRKDCHLHGGRNTVIKKNKVVANNDNCFAIYGTLKKTTTITSNYTKTGTTDNSANRFTLSDMDGIEIGDVMVIQATDQFYSYARDYYYLGATLLISDMYDGHIYTSNSMPFSITNTENVTVKVYSAPEVIIENLNFESDISGEKTRWYYSYLIWLSHCKKSIIRNCNFTEFDMGIAVNESVNTLLDNITLSKSIYDNTIDSDGYGVEIISASDTTINRLFAVCAQNAIDLSGTFPNINTYVYNSNINAECRGAGLGLHENNYNIVIEDCVIGGLSLYGTATVNRCRIIKNNRPGLDVSSISIYGSYDPERAKYKITNCEIDGTNMISLSRSITQDNPTPFNSVIGLVEISNCNGGTLRFVPTSDPAILSNTLKKIIIDKWTNCYEFYHTENNVIECCIIKDSTFTKKYWLNKHTDELYIDYIRFLQVENTYPQRKKIYIDADRGGLFYLPAGVKINMSAESQTAHHSVCGQNVASNKADDFSVGAVSGSVDASLTRTVNNNFSSSITVNAEDEIVFTQPNNTTKVDIYHKSFVFVHANSRIRMSCKLKNTGETSGAGFRAYLAIINASTGLVTYKNNGTSATATAEGASVSHYYDITADSYVLVYLYCYSPVAQSETTISDFVAKVMPIDFIESPMTFVKYEGNSIDGDGALTSVDGENHVMSSLITGLSVNFKADLLAR